MDIIDAPDFKLSIEDEKILETPTALYDYIKERYGITSSEEPGMGCILKSMAFVLLGSIEKSLPNTQWIIQLTVTKNTEPFPDQYTLQFIVNSPNELTYRKTLVSISASVHHDVTRTEGERSYVDCHYDVAVRNLYEKRNGFDSFAAVTEFFKILKDFMDRS